MLWIAQLVAFPWSDTMSFVTSLLFPYRRYAMVSMSLSNCSPLHGEALSLILKMVRAWMLLRMAMVFGEVAIRRSSLMLKCLILTLHLIEVANGSSLSSLYHQLEKEKQRSMSNAFIMWRWDVLLLWCFTCTFRGTCMTVYYLQHLF